MLENLVLIFPDLLSKKCLIQMGIQLRTKADCPKRTEICWPNCLNLICCFYFNKFTKHLKTPRPFMEFFYVSFVNVNFLFCWPKQKFSHHQEWDCSYFGKKLGWPGDCYRPQNALRYSMIKPSAILEQGSRWFRTKLRFKLLFSDH